MKLNRYLRGLTNRVTVLIGERHYTKEAVRDFPETVRNEPNI